MSDVIRFKRSGVTGAAPSDLALGEPAYNYADNKLFFKDAAGSIVEFGGSGGGLVTAATPAAFPATGSATSLYVATDSQQAYRWDTTNSVYVEVGPVGGGLPFVSVPASATSPGTVGQVATDGVWWYACYATNAWVRTALSTWPIDQYFSSVVLLMHGDGDLADSSSYARTLTAYGNAAGTGAAKYGSGSIAFDGTGDYITAPASPAWALDGNFTIEGWAYVASSSPELAGFLSSQVIGDESPSLGTFVIAREQAFLTTTNFLQANQCAWTTPTNQWFHFAFVNDSGTLRAYVNGVQASSVAKTITVTAQRLVIGGRFIDDRNYDLNGRLDDIRITSGICRYPAGTTFTPPTAAFPDA